MEIYEQPRTLALSEFVDLVKSYSDIDGWDPGDVDDLFSGVGNSLRDIGCETIEVQNYYPMALAMKKA